MEVPMIDIDPTFVGFTPTQLTVLKRQIACCKLINVRLKTVATGSQALPVPVAPARRPGGGRSRASKQQQARRGKKAVSEAGSGSDVEPIKEEEPKPSSSEEPELEVGETSEDEELNLSDSSLSAGAAPAGKGGSTAAARRSARRRSTGKLKEPSSSSESDSSHSEDSDTENKPKGTISPNKRRKFVVVGPSGGNTQTEVHLSTLKPMQVPWPVGDEAICSVCGDGDSTEDNPILYCEGKGCEVAVHMLCYGVGAVPKGKWLCDACGVKKKRGVKLRCALCPVEGGALRRVTTLGKVVPALGAGTDAWAHLACALWTPEVRLRDPSHMDGIDLSGLTQDRVDLKCTVCGQAGGTPVQCCYGSCCRAFHVLCGRFGGHEVTFNTNADPLAFCAIHSRPQYTAVRQEMIHGMDFDEAVEAAAKNGGVGGEDEEGGDDGAPAEVGELVEYELERQQNLARIAEARRALFGVGSG